MSAKEDCFWNEIISHNSHRSEMVYTYQWQNEVMFKCNVNCFVDCVDYLEAPLVKNIWFLIYRIMFCTSLTVIE